MTLAELKGCLSHAMPPAGLAPPLVALWWQAKGDWERAHALVMDEADRDCAWVHAYLHRQEGDLANARYWYGQAGKTVARARCPRNGTASRRRFCNRTKRLEPVTIGPR